VKVTAAAFFSFFFNPAGAFAWRLRLRPATTHSNQNTLRLSNRSCPRDVAPVDSGNPLFPKPVKKQNPLLSGRQMKFNLLELHDPAEDTSVRKLLRVYSVVPRFAKTSNKLRLEQAIKVNTFLRKVNTQLKANVSRTWKVDWIKSTGYYFSPRAYVDWFLGKASIPLIALKQLKMFGFEKEVNDLIENCDFFCSTSARPFRMPHTIGTDLAYLTGAILGDGHIRKNAYNISFEVSERWLTLKFIAAIGRIFEHKLSLRERLDRGKIRHLCCCQNKPAVRIFTTFLSIPRGKKSHIIVVPDLIKKFNKNIRQAFLEGVFDTDGGKRSGGFGLTLASKLFCDQVWQLLKDFDIRVYKDEWVNRKYNKSYYGLYFYKNNPNLGFILHE